jgi:hypothetical protein
VGHLEQAVPDGCGGVLSEGGLGDGDHSDTLGVIHHQGLIRRCIEREWRHAEPSFGRPRRKHPHFKGGAIRQIAAAGERSVVEDQKPVLDRPAMVMN